MEISQGDLACLYLYALLLGTALGAFYDLFRITRVFLGVHYSRRAARRLQELRLPLLTPHKRHEESRALGLVVFFEDLIFCLLSGAALILLFYEANNGKFRFPVLICAGAGFLLYRGTLGRPVMMFSEIIAFLIETFFRYLFFFLLFPFRMAARWIKKRLRTAARTAADQIEKQSRSRFTATELGRAGRNACGLIPEDLPKNKTLKRGKPIGNRKEKTIHTHASDARPSRRARCGGHRCVRK